MTGFECKKTVNVVDFQKKDGQRVKWSKPQGGQTSRCIDCILAYIYFKQIHLLIHSGHWVQAVCFVNHNFVNQNEKTLLIPEQTDYFMTTQTHTGKNNIKYKAWIKCQIRSQ